MKVSVEKDFQDAVTERKIRKAKKPDTKAVCVRFTESERAELERKAGDLSLSSYIRGACIGDFAPTYRTRGKRPVKDHESLAHLLGILGQSRLSNNVNQLAKAANNGTLDLEDDTQAAIMKAAYDIAYIRMTLIKALGLTDDKS